MRLKILAEDGAFHISFESERCCHLSGMRSHCPGRIESCPDVSGPEECERSGGTTFSVLFRNQSEMVVDTPLPTSDTNSPGEERNNET